MQDAWQLLRDGGLPLAEPRRDRRPSARELAGATRAAIASHPSGREAEALAAFLLAWHHHWPRSFADAHGADATAVVDWATRHVIDDNRYLKLRRIALENLADVV
jgi:hypothetical protein